MKILIGQSLGVAILTWILSVFFPWWICAIAACFVFIVFRASTPKALMAGFLGVGLLWAIQSTVLNWQGSGILGNRMASVMGLSSPVLLILVTALMGAVCGALGAMCGKYIRDIIWPPPIY